MIFSRFFGCACLLGVFTPLVFLPTENAAGAGEAYQVESLEVTILSTMLTQSGVGEWGFAAIIEADGHRILFDTGNRPNTVLMNAQSLGLDLSNVEDVVLSHNHGDHTGGLISLRRKLSARNPNALSRAHAGQGIFWERPGLRADQTTMASRRDDFEELGGIFIEYDRATEIIPGIWVTGPVPRIHPEKNYSVGRQVLTPDGPTEDNIPESMSLIINTTKGLVVISGCGHSGMINTLEYAQAIVRPAPIHAAIGGFHLLHSTNEHLDWTANKLVNVGLENLIGAHCTGIEPVYQFRELIGIGRDNAVIGATGASFSLDGGIEPLSLAQ